MKIPSSRGLAISGAIPRGHAKKRYRMTFGKGIRRTMNAYYRKIGMENFRLALRKVKI